MSERSLPVRALIASAALVIATGCGIAGQSTAPTAGTTSAPTRAATADPTVGATTGATAEPTTGETAAPSAAATAGATTTPSEEPTPQPTIAGEVVFGNWPLYIDIDEETGDYPTLEQFTANTGIEVSYQEDIRDNSEFFGGIQPDLAAGNPTGYDIIAPSDWMVAKMIRLGYLQPLDHSLLPNFTANVQEALLDPWYDPGNAYSIPWQAGIVGIGYNPELTGREITSFDDLLDPAFAGNVGMFSEMIDTMSMTLLSMGIEPSEATMEDVQAAQQKLLGPAQAGQFQDFYGNEYYDALANGDIALTMAWSGDISQMQLWDNPDVRFVIPDTGGMLFVDNMVIPNGAQHPADAYALMDYWYSLEAAVPLTEYIGYFSPVQGVQEAVLEDAAEARNDGDEEWATQLEQIARDSFPDEETLSQLHQYKQLTEEEEQQWNELFNEIVSG